MIVDGNALFASLQTAPDDVRRSAANEIVTRYLDGDPSIGAIARTFGEAAAAHTLGNDWNRIELPPNYMELTGDAITDILASQIAPGQRAFGEIPTRHSIQLPEEVVRVQRYAQAIDRAPRANTEEPNHIIDAGCGSFPILSILAAMLHEGAKVTAYEVSSDSAKTARHIVGLLGLSEQISIINADILDEGTEIPPSHIAMSETLAAGLLFEPIAQIMGRLAAAGAIHLIPKSAEVYVVDAGIGERRQATSQLGTHLATLDFSDGDDAVVGSFMAVKPGKRDVYARVVLRDSGDEVIIGDEDLRTVDIASYAYIGSVRISEAGPVKVVYPAGVHPNYGARIVPIRKDSDC